MTIHPSAHPRSVAKGEKLAQRLAQIIAQLHQGDRIDKYALASKFDVDVRTIERDLGERLSGIAESDGKGHWVLAATARSSIPANSLQQFADVAGIGHLYPDRSVSFLLAQIETPRFENTFQVQPPNMEDLTAQLPKFRVLQHAIEHHHPCGYLYKGKDRRVNPYRLIHRDGIWYLAATEGEIPKNFSVGLIEGLSVDVETQFKHDPAHNTYFAEKQDVWFTDGSTEVLLRVSPDMAKYFARRSLLPHQSHYFDTDGTLLVRAQISHPNQLLPVVRYWLPHVRILQPQAWHEDLVHNLNETLRLWNTTESST